MYVCICHGVTDKQIRREVDRGNVTTVRDMQQTLKVGTCCGKCACEARQILQDAQAAPSLPAPDQLHHWLPSPFGDDAVAAG